jgi:trk system potassium uptake protein TrkH
MKRFDYFIGAVAIVAFFMLLAELSGYLDQYAEFFRLANLVVLALFLIHVAVSFITSKSKLAHIKHNWLDLIVFIPLVQLYHGMEDSPSAVIVRQVVIVFMVISRTRKANKLVSLLGLKPAQLMLTSFAAAICIGTVLLMLPAATVSGVRTSLVDALYTATSATCVTGLIVKDTAVYFSRFGQCVILALIQMGALGIMTFSVSLAIFARKRVDMQRQIEMQEMLDQDTIASIKDLLTFIVRMAFAFELAGAVGLFFAWRGKIGGDGVTAFHAAFHSVSAFCNAGFSTFSDSLVRFSGDVATNVVVIVLIVFGGLGFTVVRDIIGNVRERAFRRSPRVLSLRVQTKIVLAVSATLTVAGAVLFYALERSSLLAGAGIKNGILVSLFQSVTARTAGFNTCDFGALSSASLMVIIILMFVGASPGSTGGGIKTTTVAVLWSAIVSGLRKRPDAELYRRTIPTEVIQKALSVLIISLVVVLAFGLVLLYYEDLPFSSVMFETVSAFGTVGLSTGISPQFTTAGKIAVTLLMFTGRLGPLTIAYAFLRQRRAGQYRFAEERVMIG